MKGPAAIMLLAACVGCGGSTAMAPSATATSISSDPTLTFSGLATDGAPVGAYTESGFTVSAATPNWTARTTYGNPTPFIQFSADGGATVAGAVRVSAGGATFYFKAVDVYSSTTPIPYTMTGLRGSTVVFTETGTVPNTFGNFRTVSNSHSQDLIDMLSITLSNAAAPCCRNPMGLDNIVLTPTPTVPTAPTSFALTGRVTNSTTNAAISGATVSVRDGPNAGRSAATDSSGAYSLDQLLASTFTLNVSAPGFVAQTRTVTVTSDQTVAVQLAPETSALPLPPGAIVIAFTGESSSGAPAQSYTESGFTVTAVQGDWKAVTTYGNPAPFIEFSAPGGTTTAGEVRVSGGGRPFGFYSVDLYASTTPIPYTIIGSRNSSPVFTLKETVPNTFGRFRTVANPNPALVVDTISIVLTNTAAQCCANPMGLDTIVLTR
jgi:hypothetical protein